MYAYGQNIHGVARDFEAIVEEMLTEICTELKKDVRSKFPSIFFF